MNNTGAKTFGIYGSHEYSASDMSTTVFDIAWKANGNDEELIGAFRIKEGVTWKWSEEILEDGEKRTLLAIESNKELMRGVLVSVVFNAWQVMDGQASNYVETLWNSWVQ